tara:strand:- start:237 stop:1232 length:996 start_codon:yes stop_codon:yes gene_type:complete
MNLRQIIYIISTIAVIAIIATLSRLGFSENETIITMENISPLNRDIVDKIIITDGVNQTTLTKNNLNWKVGNYPVVFDGFEEMWEVISNFPKARLISNNESNHSLMGVSESNSTAVEFYNNQTLVEKFLIGDKVYAPMPDEENIYTPWTSLSRMCYIREPGSKEVYGVFCQYPDRFNPKPEMWAEPTILKIPMDEIESILYRYPQTEFQLKILPNNQWIIIEETGPSIADVNIANKLLSEFSQLVTSDFPNPKNVNNLDLLNPTIAITVIAKPNSGNDSVDLFLFEDSQQQTGGYYIKNRINDWVYYIDSNTSSSILKYPFDLIEVDSPDS